MQPRHRLRTVTSADIFQFIAIIYYLGIVRLPNKKDLWSTHDELPLHKVAKGMSRDQFMYIWRDIALMGDQADGNLLDEYTDDETDPVNWLDEEDFEENVEDVPPNAAWF